MEANEDVADQNQDGLMGLRKMQGKWFVETGWQLPRIEVMATFDGGGQGPPRAVETMMMMIFMTGLYP